MTEPVVGDGALDDYGKHLYEALHAASRDYDQAIISVAGATLALSVTFAHDIRPQPIAGTTNVLLLAWGLLVVSIVAIIVSFVSSQAEIRHMIGGLPNPPTSWRGGLTTVLNLIAGGALVGGLAMLGWYALLNT